MQSFSENFIHENNLFIKYYNIHSNFNPTSTTKATAKMKLKFSSRVSPPDRTKLSTMWIFQPMLACVKEL